jgi:uncharacterized protein (TIGR02646 family)
MRELTKLTEPSILSNNSAEWLSEYLTDKSNDTKKYRYRHTDIKSALKDETSHKCVYCESKIGHNTPGDIEHKIPSSKNPSLHFTWSNLTIACTECNRRKNDYYENGNEFLDPYTDPVESLLVHHGPVVSPITNVPRAEITVKTLKLNSKERLPLIVQKIEAINHFNNLLERYATADDPALKSLLLKEIEECTAKTSEYSAMLISILRQNGFTPI